MSSSWNPPRPPARRHPVRQGLAFGVLVVAVEVLGPLLPGPARTLVLDVLGPLVSLGWGWALFAGWVGRGARTPWGGALMGALGLVAAAVVRVVADALVGLGRGVSPLDTWERTVAGLGWSLVTPAVLGLVAGLLGHLTRRRDSVGAAAGIVLALGLGGTMAAELSGALRGQQTLRVITSAVLLAGGIATAAWLAYAALRRASASGPAASVGAPETPIRRYPELRGAPAAGPLQAPDPTRPMPAYGADDPTERFPAAPRTPVDADEGDVPTRPNPRVDPWR